MSGISIERFVPKGQIILQNSEVLVFFWNVSITQNEKPRNRPVSNCNSSIPVGKNPPKNKKHICFSSPVHAPISTKLCMQIKDVRPIFVPLTFSEQTYSFFAAGAPENFGKISPIAVFCL